MKRARPRPPRLKDTRSLLRIAGLPAVSALFATTPERVERLFFEERFKAQTSAFCVALARARKPYRIVGAEELARVAGTVLHGGIVAVATVRPLASLDPAEASAWARDGKMLVLLDGIGNPHNLGAIARTAAYFGLPRLVLSDHPEQALPSDASHRVAEGGLEHLALYRAQGFAAALRRLGQSYRIIGTALGRGKPLGNLRRTDRPFALVLGNEETGLPRATLAACDEIVTIPGAGKLQSLNVSASAAILMYALQHVPREEPPDGNRKT
jgi:TrmH RNA methyltransferase